MSKRRQQARRMASKGKSAAQIQRKTGVGANRAAQVVRNHSPAPPSPQGPPASAPVHNSAGHQVHQNPTVAPSQGLLDEILASPTTTQPVNYQWVPGLLQPGQKGYDPNSGGGAWVYAQGQVDPAALRAFYAHGVSPDVAFDGTGLDRNNFTFNGMYGGNHTNQTYTAGGAGGGQGFDYAAFEARMMAQQAAVWESMDAMNSEFLRQQQDYFSQQSNQPRRSYSNFGSNTSDAAAVKRKKGKKSKSGIKTNTGLSTGSTSGTAGSGVSLGGSGGGNGLSIGKS